MTLNKYVLLLFFLASCVTKETQVIPIIDPGNIIHKKILLSDIASKIQYISICNKIPIGGINSIELTDTLMFITPFNEGLLVYDLEGKFKKRVGKRGRGPSEYRSATAFTLDKSNNFVYVLDRTNDRLLKYTFNGEFSRTINFDSEIAGSFFTEIIYSNNMIYLYEGINQGYGKYNWVILDTLGKVLSEKHNSIEVFSSIHYCSGNKQEAYNNTLFYWNQINDTIFKINEYHYEPAFLIAQGEFRFPKKIVDAVYTEYFFPREIFFTKNYVFIAYVFDFKNFTGIYSKSDNHFYSINVTEDWNYIKGPGIPNDFDSGLPLIPLSYYCDYQDKEFLIGAINPFELKAHIASEDFKNSTPKYPEKKKELIQLANRLNENDNPVLMIVKLKD